MSTKIDGWLLEILACPQSQAPLRHDPETDELVCDESGLAYPIREGIPERGMPAWEGVLPDEEIQQLTAFIASLQEAAPAVEAA
jgi:uncharacterized protein